MSELDRLNRVISRLLLVVCLVAAPWPARAAGGEAAFEESLTSLPAPQAEAMARLAQTLRERKLPLSLLAHKLEEGLAKRIEPHRIVQALVRMGDNLVWMDAQLGRCAQGAGARVRERLFGIGVDVLFSGLTREQLHPALQLACRGERPDEALSRAAELYLFLTQKLAAPLESAWSLAVETLRRDETQNAVSQLARVLQEIHQARGSVVRPLAVALVRLRAGAPLRTIKNELRDQFLKP